MIFNKSSRELYVFEIQSPCEEYKKDISSGWHTLMSLLKSFDICWTSKLIWVRTEESPATHMLSLWNSSAKRHICVQSQLGTVAITTATLLWGALFILDMFAKVAFYAWLCLCCTCLCIVYRMSVGASELMQSRYSLLPERWGLCLQGAAVICCEQEVECEQAPIHCSVPCPLCSQVY